MESLISLLRCNEDRLINILIGHAKMHGYTEFTSTLVEAWRVSVAGLTDSFCNALEQFNEIPPLKVHEDFLQDPVAAFGVEAARNHRARGVTIDQFLGLMKYYRQSYLELVQENEEANTAERLTWINRFYDRVELGFCREWLSMSDSIKFDELQETNRKLTNEKNLYLTVMESLKEPVFWLDPDLVVRYANYPASRLLKESALPGQSKYGKDVAGIIFPWLESEIKDLCSSDQSSLETTLVLPGDKGEEKILSIRASQMLDVSGKFTGITVIAEDVTEQHRNQQILLESENRLRAFFESSNEGIAIHEMVYAEDGSPIDYIITDANTSFEIHTGIKLSRALNCRASELYGQDPPPYIDIYAGVAGGEGPKKFETYYPPLKRHFRVSVFSPGPGQFSTIFSDITEAKQVEQDLRQAVETTNSITRTVPVAIGMLKERVFEWVSDRMCFMTGYSADELLGQSTRLLYPTQEEFNRVGREKYGQSREQGIGLMETRWVRKDGEVLDIQLSSSAIDPDDPDKGEVFSGLDITLMKTLQAEQEELESQMQRTQKLESLGVLAGGIAHDFNNMLVSILGNADLTLSELPPLSPVRDYIQDIETASRRAADLCRQLLAYSGKGRFIIEKIHLRELVEEMVNMLEVSIAKNVVLKFRFADQVPPVEADATQLRQIIMNLVINSSEAIGKRSGVISISTGVMECTEEYLNTTFIRGNLVPGIYSYLEVADTGMGMTKEIQEKIFEPFFSTKFTGRGLGMSAVLGIITGHAGGIKVYSEQGKGTTIKIILPAVESDLEETPSADKFRDDEKWHGEGTILLVDDDESVRTLASRYLHKFGFQVIVAEDGRKAVELYKEKKDEITAVLMDLTMPHMDGADAFSQMRAINPDVQVILTSGYNEQEVTQRFVGKGAVGFIQKPYGLAQLREILQQTLS